MAFKFRKPSVIEMVVQVIFLAPLSVFIYDFFAAAGASACTLPQAARVCYPWGPESPLWYFQTKAAYLSSVLVTILAFSLAFAIPFLARGRAMSWALVALTFTASYVFAQPLAGLLEPLMPVG